MAKPTLDKTPQAIYLCCERKQAYSYPRARRIASTIRRNKDEVVMEYHCHFCGAWHVGTNSEHIARAAEKRRNRKRRGREQRIAS
jgi:diadenosine tetraphosphate (Ap4A) HIT family hydrolase